MNQPSAFGELAQMYRLKRGYTLQSVASELGFTAVYIGDIERGNRNPPALDTARRWAEILNADPNLFVQLAMKPHEREIARLRDALEEIHALALDGPVSSEVIRHIATRALEARP